MYFCVSTSELNIYPLNYCDYKQMNYMFQMTIINVKYLIFNLLFSLQLLPQINSVYFWLSLVPGFNHYHSVALNYIFGV